MDRAEKIDLLRAAQRLAAMSSERISADEALKALIRKGYEEEVGGIASIENPEGVTNKKARRQILQDQELTDLLGGSEDDFRELMGMPQGTKDPYTPYTDSQQEPVRYQRFELFDTNPRLYDPTDPVEVDFGDVRDLESPFSRVEVAPKKATFVKPVANKPSIALIQGFGGDGRVTSNQIVSSRPEVKISAPKTLEALGMQREKAIGQELVRRGNRLTESEVKEAIDQELRRRFSGNDTAGSTIRSMPVDAYSKAKDELISRYAQNRTSRLQAFKNQIAARKEAESLLAENMAGRSLILDSPSGIEYRPQITDAELGKYIADERVPLKSNPRSVSDFIRTSTRDISGYPVQSLEAELEKARFDAEQKDDGGASFDADEFLSKKVYSDDMIVAGSPQVAAGDLLEDMRTKIIRKVGDVDTILSLPTKVDSKEDLAVLINAYRKKLGEGMVAKGKIKAKEATVGELIEELGFRGLRKDQLGYAMGQVLSTYDPETERIGKYVPKDVMRAESYEPVRFGSGESFATTSGTAVRGVRGQFASRAEYPKKGTLRTRFEELSDPDARKPVIALNREDFKEPEKITGLEGRTYKKSSETTREGIEDYYRKLGRGSQYVDEALRLQARKDAADELIQEQLRLRNQYTPRRMRL